MADDYADSPGLKTECEAAAHRAARIHAWLDPLLRNGLAAQRAYAFKARVKTSGDIRDKVLGRREHEDTARRKPDYLPSDVTDASGFRIVKLFNAEVPDALDQLLSLLETALPPGQHNGRLKDGGVKEIEFHTSRRLNDPLSIYGAVNRVVRKHGLTLKPPAQIAGQGSASSYSSVHVLLECEISERSNSLTSYSEVQLRSVFEEAWGEISHSLKYAPSKVSRASGAVSTSKDELSDFWLHLDALKSLTDGCAQYADLINRHLKSLATAPAERDPAPLDPAEKSLAQFVNCRPAIRQAAQKAYQLRSDAVQAKDPRVFRLAADAFQASVEAFSEPEMAEQKRLFDLLREELAFCYIFTENEELRNRGEKLYRELLVTNPNRISILLRLGQLRRDAGDYTEAKKLLEAALTGATRKPDPDEEVQRQTSWLSRRDLAYVCWRLADLEPTGAEALTLIRQAIDLSEAALGDAKTDAQHLNTRQNLLYYLTDYCKRLPADVRQQWAARGTHLLEEIRPQVNLEKWPIEALDTIMRAEVEFGEIIRAKDVAKVVAQSLALRVAAIRDERNCSHALAFDALSRDERDMYLHAQDVLAASDRKKDG